MNQKVNKAKLLLSSDTLSWYWLDLVFQLAQDLRFDWIDLAIWKNFDARNIDYVKRLVTKYKTPVNVIQVSEKVNKKELDYAIDLANELWSEAITINAPEILDFKTYRFIVTNIKLYKKHNHNIKFAIINPPKSSMLLLPVPKYYFSNVVEIIKKHWVNVWFDISNMDDTILESTFLRKISNYIPYMPVVYISDKNKNWQWHVPLWEWVLKLNSIFKKFKSNNFFWYLSLKLELTKKDLSDLEKVEQILKKCRLNFKENYEDLVI